MANDREIITQNAQETATLGQELAYYLRTQNLELNDQKRGQAPNATVICLYGELGSGKTTFAQGFAKGLGINARLLSPTFIIVRRYNLVRFPGFLYHLDLYRLHKEEELIGLGLSEILADSNSFVLIEWAEKLGKFLPRQRVDIHFNVRGDDTHLIKVNEYGRDSQ